MFRGRIFVCSCVQPPKGEIMIENILLLVITVALLIYLVYALLRPEKF